MTSGSHTRSALSGGARRMVLVLVLLAGVLAMHGLAPAMSPAASSPSAAGGAMMAPGAGAEETSSADSGARRPPFAEARRVASADSGTHGVTVTPPGPDAAGRVASPVSRAAGAPSARALPDPAAAGPAVAVSAHARSAPHAAAGPVHTAGGSCRHLSGADPDGTAVHHADGTCAAAGTSTAYAPPALPAASAASGAPAASGGLTPAGAAGSRAPPDLSQLQILRI
ncbi:DUF6153 family protein [Streptomyces sp. NPDC046831]|uniref:DUF6153 family protein n=1 Tax=Streptomyces sp. NPDC046831 TaxID=3154805 RepID=UPI0033FF222F